MTSPEPTSPPAPRTRATAFGWRFLALVGAFIILWLVVSRWNRWIGDARYQRTDDAYLQADFTPLSAHVAGYVSALPVEDFQRIHAGDLIVQILDDDFKAAVAQAEANAAAAGAQVDTLEAQGRLQLATIAAAEASVRAIEASLAQALRDRQRQHTLTEAGSGSLELEERADTGVAQLSAQHAQAQALADAARRQRAVLLAQTAQARATQLAQTAALQTARLNLGYTQIRAPTDGVLGQRVVRVGQYVAVGGQVATLTPLPHVWVLANYKETQLTHVRIGQSASIRVDTYPDARLKGHVIAYAPGSGAQFALLPPDNATGNFTKVVQRIAVKIVIDDANGLVDLLRPGMSVVSDIDTASAAQAR